MQRNVVGVFLRSWGVGILFLKKKKRAKSYLFSQLI